MAAHILTPNFAKKYAQLVPAIGDRIEMKTPAVADLEIRMRLMSRYPRVLQVLTMANLPLERYVEKSEDAIELAKIGNDDLADLVLRYPDKFMGAAAILPMNDVDAACYDGPDGFLRIFWGETHALRDRRSARSEMGYDRGYD